MKLNAVIRRIICLDDERSYIHLIVSKCSEDFLIGITDENKSQE